MANVETRIHPTRQSQNELFPDKFADLRKAVIELRRDQGDLITETGRRIKAGLLRRPYIDLTQEQTPVPGLQPQSPRPHQS